MLKRLSVRFACHSACQRGGGGAVCGGVHKDERAQRAAGGKGRGGDGFLQGQLDLADGVGFQAVGVLGLEGVDVQPVEHAAGFGLEPAVAVQRPVNAPRGERLVVKPAEGGLQLACDGPGGLGGGGVEFVEFAGFTGLAAAGGLGGGGDLVAAREVEFAVEHEAGAVSGVDAGLRLARVVQHLGDAGRVAAG